MNRRTLITSVIAVSITAACTAETGETAMDTATAELAPGTNRDFSFTVATGAPDAVWELWTNPETWGEWDQGLQSASLEGTMALGSTGQIVPQSGPPSAFEVTAFDPKRSYTFETRLPGSVLRIERSFNDDRTAFTHRVRFVGFSSFAFARSFGPGFRQALPPTMRTLNTLAEQRA